MMYIRFFQLFFWDMSLFLVPPCFWGRVHLYILKISHLQTSIKIIVFL